MALAPCGASMLQSMTDESGKSLQVELRQNDGFVNATLMCQSAGKLWGNYQKAKDSKAFLAASQSSIPNGTDGLVQYEKGNVCR